MQLSWPEVVRALGGQTIFLVAAAWLIRRLVSHGMDRDLAKYKMELKADADRDIEKLRNELRFEIEKHKNSLRMSELEHRVRFSKLHERRAEVIAELYRLIVGAKRFAQTFVFNNARDQTWSDAARAKIGELFESFELNRLYLPNSLCVVLDSFIEKLYRAVSGITAYWTGVEHPTPQMIEQQNEKMREVLTAFENEIPGIQSLLETEFRKLLGAVEEEWLIPVEPEKS